MKSKLLRIKKHEISYLQLRNIKGGNTPEPDPQQQQQEEERQDIVIPDIVEF